MLSKNNLETPIIIGHRGASGYAPENTLSAFEKARNLDIKWVEFDVVLTSDFIPVLLHDTTIDRTTNGLGSILQYSFDQLQVFDAGSWFAPAFKGERIPSLATVLTFLRKNNLFAVIEIKALKNNEKQVATKTMEIIEKYWPDYQDKVIVSSFSYAVLKVVRQLLKEVKIGLGVEKWQPNILDQAQQINAYSVHINQQILKQKYIHFAQAKGFKVYAYTVNEKNRARQLLNWQIDGMFSDYPDKILPLCK
ncbi:MAG: glycerophosphoryl diester phosphodiesterase [Pseudomonadota bacterium]